MSDSIHRRPVASAEGGTAPAERGPLAGPEGVDLPLMLVGVNHRTAPVDVRERLNVSDPASGVASLATLAGVDGAAILSTCNRVEAIVSCPDENVPGEIAGWLASRADGSRSDLERYLYVVRGTDVVRHLFRVASGLDSMVVGEPQIHGQVRQAFLASQASDALDPLLTQLFEQTMRVAKKVRTDTGIGEHAVSVPYAAVELARKIFGDLTGVHVLLIGAGEMGELTAEHLASQNVKQIFVANKTFERALQLAERFHGKAVQFDELERHLESADIVIASTAAPHHLIRLEQVSRAVAHRRSRGLFLIDLAVPRNIAPETGELENVYLYNVDDLQHVADVNRELRMKKAAEAEEIVDREVEAFRRRIVAQEAVPTIVELQQRLDAIRESELEKCLRRVGPISAAQREAIEQMTTQIVNKILHYPILRLKEPFEEPQERESLRATIRKIFGLR